MTSSESTARGLLDELQQAVCARDLAALAQLFDHDVALFGTGSENLDRSQTLAYLKHVVDQPGIIRWDWVDVRPLVSDANTLCFAVVGTVGLEESPEQREAFRLTCIAVRDDSRWRLRHFHGSVPQRS